MQLGGQAITSSVASHAWAPLDEGMTESWCVHGLHEG